MFEYLYNPVDDHNKLFDIEFCQLVEQYQEFEYNCFLEDKAEFYVRYW